MLLSYPLTSSHIFLHHFTIGDSVLQEKFTFWNAHFISFQYGKADSVKKEEQASTASFPLGHKPQKGIQEESSWKMTLSSWIRSLWLAAHTGDSTWPAPRSQPLLPASVVCASPLQEAPWQSQGQKMSLNNCTHVNTAPHNLQITVSHLTHITTPWVLPFEKRGICYFAGGKQLVGRQPRTPL